MDRRHVIQPPAWILVICGVQAVLSVIVLGLSAYGIYYIPFNAYCLSLFTAIWSILVLSYQLIAIFALPRAYSWIAALVLEALSVIFWLSSGSTLAALYAAGVDLYTYYDPYDPTSYGSPTYGGPYVKRDTTVGTYVNVIIVTLVFCFVQFLLSVVTLSVLGLGVAKHRRDGGPARAAGTRQPEPANETEMINA